MRAAVTLACTIISTVVLCQELKVSVNYVYGLNQRFGRYKDIHPGNRLPATNYYFAPEPSHGTQVGVAVEEEITSIFNGLEGIGLRNIITVGVGLDLNYLGHIARHEVGFESLGIIDGVENRIYHYDWDRSRMMYLTPTLQVAVDLNWLILQYRFGWTFLTTSRTRRQELYLNNPYGYTVRSESYDVPGYRIFNPDLPLHSLHVTIPVSEQTSVQFGHQWSIQSMLRKGLLWYEYGFPFRNFLFGIQIDLCRDKTTPKP